MTLRRAQGIVRIMSVNVQFIPGAIAADDDILGGQVTRSEQGGVPGTVLSPCQPNWYN